MDVTFDFSGKSVLVAGGSRGIGKQIVEDFIKAGAFVSYLSRQPMGDFTRAKHISCDLSIPAEILKAFEKIDNLDFLVNVAAINYCKPIQQIDPEEWDEVLSINLKSFYLTS